MIGIIGAMKTETDALISAMQERKETTISGITYTSGKLCGKEVVVATCGIGKVFAAICAQTMILSFFPSLIINTGVGGTLTPALGIGDIAIAERLVQHDMDTSPLGDPVGLVSGINRIYFDADAGTVARLAACVSTIGVNGVRGCIASGDQFIADPAKKTYIRDTFSAIACEMEGAAIAHVATVNEIPFAVLRAISDSADGGAVEDYPTFVARAAARSVEVLCRFLSDM